MNHEGAVTFGVLQGRLTGALVGFDSLRCHGMSAEVTVTVEFFSFSRVSLGKDENEVFQNTKLQKIE